VAGDAAERAGQDLVLQAAILQSAAAAVFDGNDAVDVREILEPRFIEPLGDVLANRGGAIDRRNHRQVIPRPCFAARAAVAQESAAFDRSQRRRNGGAAGVILDEISLVQVVGMDVVAGFDVLSGRADDLAVLVDLFPFGDGANGDFVAELHELGQRHARPRDLELVTLFQVAGGDADVVIGMEIDGVGQRAGDSRHRNVGRRRKLAGKFELIVTGIFV
jgi:hypothetical protein